MTAAAKTAERFAALEARIVALEAERDELRASALDIATQVNTALAKAVADGLVPLAQETQRAHARLDAAARAFKALSPKREPTPRLAPAAWDRALADLREETGNETGWHSREAVYARHLTLQRMEAQQRAAEDELAA